MIKELSFLFYLCSCYVVAVQSNLSIATTSRETEVVVIDRPSLNTVVQVTSQAVDCMFGYRIETCSHGCCADSCCPSGGVVLHDKYFYMGGGAIVLIVAIIGCCLRWKIHKDTRDRQRQNRANAAVQLAQTTANVGQQGPTDDYQQPVPNRFEPLPSVKSLLQASE